ncbi:MAG: hypothetical protein AAF716_03855 [Cyanobacteria bacterium P01_D01_bin.1]
MIDLNAGADRYVAMREDWNAQISALASYMDYRWQEIERLIQREDIQTKVLYETSSQA